jgi:hypothetical protein
LTAIEQIPRKTDADRREVLAIEYLIVEVRVTTDERELRKDFPGLGPCL